MISGKRVLAVVPARGGSRGVPLKNLRLVAGVPLLEYAEFMPNHPKIGQYNAITFQGVQAVETGEMSPEEAVEMVVEELETELGDDVVILD